MILQTKTDLPLADSRAKGRASSGFFQRTSLRSRIARGKTHLISAIWVHILDSVQRAVGLILLAVFAATGSGLLKYLHLREDAAACIQPLARSSISLPHQDHDENNCPICMTLLLQITVTGYVPLLIFLGLLLAFLSLVTPPPFTRPLPVWIESRGPPVF